MKRDEEEQTAGEGKGDNDDHMDAPPVKKRNVGTRALRACDMCRHQKTRCFPKPDGPGCLRCHVLNTPCSFLDSDCVEPDVTQTHKQYPRVPDEVNARLDRMEKTMESMMEMMKELKDTKRTPSVAAAGRLTRSNTGIASSGAADFNYRNVIASFGTPAVQYVTSPFQIIAGILPEKHIPLPVQRLLNPQMVLHDQDVISMDIVSESMALRFLQDFRQNCGRWVSFPLDLPVDQLLVRIRQRCSLLLTVVCCVALRYNPHMAEYKDKVYPLLLNKLQQELTASLLVVPQTIEFMQALTLLSIYGLSLSAKEFVIDSWFISSVALQHFITKDALGLVMSADGISPVTEFDEVTTYRVWNHLCLAHLVHCVMTGRMCILDEIRLDQCRRSLDLSSATNFDGRMIAEISFQLIVYNFIETLQPLQTFEDELAQWLEQWGYLFEQPTTQFTETGYHYGYLVVLYHSHYRSLYLKKKSQKPTSNGNDHHDKRGFTSLLELTELSESVFDPFALGLVSDDPQFTVVSDVLEEVNISTLYKMASLGRKVIDGLLNVADDEYFRHLSDQLHFSGLFTGLLLCRMMSVVRDRQASKKPNSASDAKEASETHFQTVADVDVWIREMLSKVVALSKRFHQLTSLNSDLVKNYALALDENIALLTNVVEVSYT